MTHINLDGFQFLGFDPSDEIQSQAKDLFWKIESQSPSRAARTGSLVKSGENYKGVIKIMSKVGQFTAEAESPNPSDILNELDSKITHDLEAWILSRSAK